MADQDEDFCPPPCARCKCCDAESVQCPTCLGDGVDGHECGEDTCCCLNPVDNYPCLTCEGEGHWLACLGRCNDAGVHEKTGARS